MGKKNVVGKFRVVHDDPGGTLPFTVVAEHANENGQGWETDLVYFETKKEAVQCAKRLRAVLRGWAKRRRD